MTPVSVPGCAVLTYHSQNVGGERSPVNDHTALAADLEALHAAGLRLAPLASLLGSLEGSAWPADTTVCLTFDDGCDLDVRDIEFPGAGLQRSFLGILEDFRRRHGPEAQPGLHATSFVIASAEARRRIDARSLFARGWMNDDWWAAAARHPLMAIGNHGLDHNHPDLGGNGRGGFSIIDSPERCREQVLRAAILIEQRCGRWPEAFAYPFGESSDYLRGTWFPGFVAEHRCRAAFGTAPGWITPDSDRWNLPRFVCGRDWTTPGELLGLLAAGPEACPAGAQPAPSSR